MTHFGIIAEDQSDVDVLKALFERYGLSRFSTDKFLGKGCGKIKGKCRSWALDLKKRGCSRLILMHDLDERRVADLAAELKTALGPSPIRHTLILIPVRELEAWLLADSNAIKTALNLRENIKTVANPESIRRPKEYLRDVIYRASQKRVTYINTVHNKKIASACSLDALKRCQSFLSLDAFITSCLN